MLRNSSLLLLLTKGVHGATQALKRESNLNSKCTHLRNYFADARLSEKKKIYNARKLVGFSMEQMYTVVSDVENYNKFVPFCTKSHVLVEASNFLKADLIVGFPPIVEKYTSNVTLIRPRMVKSVCKDGKLFNHLQTTWKFSPALKNNLQSCIIDFHITFEFRSKFHSHLAHYFFDALVRQMEVAFINEARVRYGKETVPVQRLEIINNRS